MAIQELLNNEPRSSFRAKLNNMFTELYASITSIGVNISNLNTSITTLNTTTSDLTTSINTANTNITNNSNSITNLNKIGISSINASSALTPVTLSTTYTKLTYFNTISIQAGTYTTANIPAQTVTVGATGIYKVFGTINAAYPSSDSLSIKLYKNGVAITPDFSVQGLGTSKPTNISYSTTISLTSGDVLELYAASSASSSSVTVTASTVSFEKTLY